MSNTAERSPSEIEAALYANQAMAAGGKAAEALARLKRARGQLAYLQLALAAPTMGYNVGEPDAEFKGMSRQQVAALAAEAMDYLTSLLPPK